MSSQTETLSSIQNSTNVRNAKPVAVPLGLRAYFATLRFLARRAPRLADPLLERAFLTAPRFARPAWEAQYLAGAEHSRLPTDDGVLPLWSWGPTDAPIVLLVHGWGGRGSQLAAFVPGLLAAGKRVVTFDAPGHGDGPRSLTSIVTIAKAIDAVARSLENESGGGVETIIAHSVGGAATALAATRRDDARDPLARRYVFLGSPAHPRDFIAQFASFLNLGEDRLAVLRRRLERRYGFAFAELDVTKARAPAAPLLLVHDEDDAEVPIAHGRQLAAAWAGSKLIETKALGHRKILRSPEVLTAVLEFAASAVAKEGRAESVEQQTLDRELYERDRRYRLAA